MTVTTEQTCTCGGQLITHNDEVVCSKCGLVVCDVMFSTRAWYASEDPYRQDYSGLQSTHLVNPLSLTSLGTVIARHDLPTARKSHRAWHLANDRRRFDKIDRVFPHLKRIVTELRLPQQLLVRTTVLIRENAWRAWNTNSSMLMVACLIRAAREQRVPLRLASIRPLMPHGIQANCLNKMLIRLGVSRWVLQPRDFVPQIISMLRTDPFILKRLKKRQIDPERFFQDLFTSTMHLFDLGPPPQGRNPAGLAAAYCYLAQSVPAIMQRSFSGIAPDSTVRDQVSILRRMLNLQEVKKRE